MKRILTGIACVTCFAILSGCGPAALIKRAERLIAKAEAKGAKWKETIRIDTVYADTVLIAPEIVYDTVWDFNDRDTLIAHGGNGATTKVKVTSPKIDPKTGKKDKGSISAKTDCPPQEIKYRYKYIVNKNTKRALKAGLTTWQIIGLCVFFALFGFMANDLWRKFRGKREART